MCRMISISGKIEYKKTLLILKKFQRLAKYGKVPTGFKKGHKDGWGVLAYKKGYSIIFVKSCKDALENTGYSKAIAKLKSHKPNIIISHLRKASIGVNNINNTHPFVYKKYSFCQNGTIFESENIPLKGRFKNLVKGETDSEKFFFFILQFIDGCKKPNSNAVIDTIGKAIIYVRDNFDFTAINIIFSDGKYVWASREINEKNRYVLKEKLMDYYSLFIGSNREYTIVCSEKLPLKDVKWRALKNHELVEICVKEKISRYKMNTK